MTHPTEKLKELITQTFRDLTLCLGGIFILHNVEDSLVWTITNSLKAVYLDALDRLTRLSGEEPPKKKPLTRKVYNQPHPAIESLLNIILKDKED